MKVDENENLGARIENLNFRVCVYASACERCCMKIRISGVMVMSGVPDGVATTRKPGPDTVMTGTGRVTDPNLGPGARLLAQNQYKAR